MKHLNRLKSSLFDNKSIFLLYIVITVVAILQLSIDRNNNFRIFHSSSFHLLKGLPLYIKYLKEYYDFFYYNPVFPILFMPFAIMSLFPGLIAWLFATVLCCYFILKKIPFADHKVKAFMLLLLFDLLNNLNHQQTNPFVLAFMLLVWILMEKEHLFRASMFIVLSFLITILVSTLIPTDISKAFDQFRYQYFLKCVLSLLILADIMIYTIVHTARTRKYLKPAQI